MELNGPVVVEIPHFGPFPWKNQQKRGKPQPKTLAARHRVIAHTGSDRHADDCLRKAMCKYVFRTGKFIGEYEVLSLHEAQPGRFREHGTPTAYNHKLSMHKLTERGSASMSTQNCPEQVLSLTHQLTRTASSHTPEPVLASCWLIVQRPTLAHATLTLQQAHHRASVLPSLSNMEPPHTPDPHEPGRQQRRVLSLSIVISAYWRALEGVQDVELAALHKNVVPVRLGHHGEHGGALRREH
eukprot:1151611-Pelagomonas_calceolata.AAC.4